MSFNPYCLDRVYPLWLVPCHETCSATSRCFWSQSKLLRFGFNDKFDLEYLEASGEFDFDLEGDDFGRVFTHDLSETTWKVARSYLDHSTVRVLVIILMTRLRLDPQICLFETVSAAFCW